MISESSYMLLKRIRENEGISSLELSRDERKRADELCSEKHLRSESGLQEKIPEIRNPKIYVTTYFVSINDEAALRSYETYEQESKRQEKWRNEDMTAFDRRFKISERRT